MKSIGMKGSTLFLVLVFLNLYNVCHSISDPHCSINDVQLLLKLEIEFVQVLNKLASLNCPLAKELQSYIDRNYGHTIFSTEKATQREREEYVSHPINSLGIFKRMGYDFEQRAKTSAETYKTHYGNRTHFLTETWPDEANALLTRANEIAEEFPNVFEYGSACDSIILLQEAYDLETKDLSEGVVRFDESTFHSHYKMSWLEYYHLGQTFFPPWVL